MKQIYHPYYLWEDYQHGLFDMKTDNDNHNITLSKNLLMDCNKLYESMKYVAFNWHHAAEVNLSNNSRNHQAWLGQAACLYSCGSPEYITKQAWHLLSADEQTKANSVADNVYKLWLESRINKCQKGFWE